MGRELSPLFSVRGSGGVRAPAAAAARADSSILPRIAARDVIYLT